MLLPVYHYCIIRFIHVSKWCTKDVGPELGKLHFFVCDCDFEKLTHTYFKSVFSMVFQWLLRILKDFWSASDSEFLNHVTVFLSVVIWGLLAPRSLRRENYIICLHRGPDKSPLLLCSLGHTGWRHSVIQWNLMIKLGIYMESAFNPSLNVMGII